MTEIGERRNERLTALVGNDQIARVAKRQNALTIRKSM
jgi:hypothetical protein